VFAITLPVDIFRRFDFDFTAMRTEYEVFEEGSENLVYPIIDTVYTKDVYVPRLSYVKDTTIWGTTGPAAGSRYSLSVEKSLVDVFGSDLSYTTGVLDFRKYFRVTANTHFATRLVAAGSQGSQPMSFYLGGPSTLRGYDYFQFAGNNIVLGNAELRFPFVESLVLRGPVPISLGGIRGVFFFDVGGAWSRYFEDIFTGKAVKLNEDMDKLAADYGFGMRMWLAYFLLKLDFAWATDFSGEIGREVYFSLGADF
jgi:outer membrane protein assembly factor BamA